MLKRLTIEKVVASCWLFISFYYGKKVYMKRGLLKCFSPWIVV